MGTNMKTKPIQKGAFNLWIILLMAALLLFPELATAKKSTPLIITDMMGRRVTIKGPVNKIVTTFKPATLCVLSLGLAHKLVGVDTSSKKDRLQLAVFPDIANIKAVGSKTMGINFETLVFLKPDLVILYSQKEGLALADRLAAMDIASIVILPETFDSIKNAMQIIAQSVGEPERTRGPERQMDGVLDFIKTRLSGLSEDKKKIGYFASAIGLFSTATGNMLQNEIFTNAGIKNVSGHLTGYFQDISPEQLVKWNPDIMILSQHMKKSGSQRLSDKALQKIPAILQSSVYRCPSSLAPWDFPSPLSVLATLWVAQKAYPERFLDVNCLKMADDFHHSLFGKTMTQMGGSLSDTIDLKK